MAPGSAGLEALSVHPSAGAAEPSGLTHDTCIHVPACAGAAATLNTISAASAGPMMPRRPMTFLLKRAEF
jgi:hypothetical protein